MNEGTPVSALALAKDINKPSFQNITREELVVRRMFDDPVVQNRVLPHLDPSLFEDQYIQLICNAVLIIYKKYNKFPSVDELSVALDHDSSEKLKFQKIMITIKWKYVLQLKTIEIKIDIINL